LEVLFLLDVMFRAVFSLPALILSYHLILCLFEAFQFYAGTSHPLKKCGWKSPIWCQAKFLTCEISDFIPRPHIQSNILHTKCVGKTDY